MKSLVITAIVITAFGLITTFTGALFKLEHLPGASAMLTLGLLLQAIGVVLLAAYFIRRANKVHP